MFLSNIGNFITSMDLMITFMITLVTCIDLIIAFVNEHNKLGLQNVAQNIFGIKILK